MKRVVNMQKKVPYVAQLGNMDCSIACMTMLFRYYGLDVDIVDVGRGLIATWRCSTES